MLLVEEHPWCSFQPSWPRRQAQTRRGAKAEGGCFRLTEVRGGKKEKSSISCYHSIVSILLLRLFIVSLLLLPCCLSQFVSIRVAARHRH